MVDERELEICRRRGHDAIIRAGWTKCKWCGLWVREKRIIEERQDQPPDEELDPSVIVRRNMERIGSRLGDNERRS